jgi:hypothetical protein
VRIQIRVHQRYVPSFNNNLIRGWKRYLQLSVQRSARVSVFSGHGTRALITITNIVEYIHSCYSYIRLICIQSYFLHNSCGRTGLSRDTTVSSDMSVSVSTTNRIPGTPRAPDTSMSGTGPPPFDALCCPLITARTFLRELRLVSMSVPGPSHSVHDADIVMKEHEYTVVPTTSAMSANLAKGQIAPTSDEDKEEWCVEQIFLFPVRYELCTRVNSGSESGTSSTYDSDCENREETKLEHVSIERSAVIASQT